MKKKLSTTYEGNNYDITLKISGFTGKSTIIINDEVFENVQKQSGTFGCVIYPIKFGETNAELVMRNGKLSVAIDGISTEDGQEVDRGVKPPWWIYIFLVLCGILVFIGGGIGAGAGFGFGTYAYIYACKKDKNNTQKFFIAFGSTIAAWAIWLLVVLVLLG